MAYPTVSKTYGFKPVNRLDGLPYAGAIRQIPVAPAYALFSMVTPLRLTQAATLLLEALLLLVLT